MSSRVIASSGQSSVSSARRAAAAAASAGRARCLARRRTRARISAVYGRPWAPIRPAMSLSMRSIDRLLRRPSFAACAARCAFAASASLLPSSAVRALARCLSVFRPACLHASHTRGPLSCRFWYRVIGIQLGQGAPSTRHPHGLRSGRRRFPPTASAHGPEHAQASASRSWWLRRMVRSARPPFSPRVQRPFAHSSVTQPCPRRGRPVASTLRCGRHLPASISSSTTPPRNSGVPFGPRREEIAPRRRAFITAFRLIAEPRRIESTHASSSGSSSSAAAGAGDGRRLRSRRRSPFGSERSSAA